MTNKARIILIAFALITILTFSVATASAQTVVNLIADGGSVETAIVVGSVEAVMDGDGNLIVTVANDDPENPWVIGDTKIAAGELLEDIPQTKKGNPKVGHFPYISGDPIPLDLTVGVHTVYIAAHAEVLNPDELVEDPETGELVPRQESAWGEGEGFPGKNWAMYFTFTYEVLP